MNWVPNMYTKFRAKVMNLIPSKIQRGSCSHDAYHLGWLVDNSWMIILKATTTHWVLQRGIWFFWDFVTIGIGLEQRPGRILLKRVLLLKALECLRKRKDCPRQKDNQMEALVGMPGHTPQCLCIGCVKGLNFILWTLKRPRTVIHVKVRKWARGEDRTVIYLKVRKWGQGEDRTVIHMKVRKWGQEEDRTVIHVKVRKWGRGEDRTVIYLKIRKWGQGENIPGPCQICVWGWNISTHS